MLVLSTVRAAAACGALVALLAAPTRHTLPSPKRAPATTPPRRAGAPAPPASPLAATTPASVATLELPAATTGVVEGVALYASATPVRIKQLTNTIDVAACGATIHGESLIVSGRSSVANVFVEVLTSEGSVMSSALTTRTDDTAAAPLRVSIRQCALVPHVLLVPAGSPVEVVSPDGVLHQLVGLGVRNPQVVVDLPRYRRRVVVDGSSLKRPETIKIVCERHPWMVGYWIVTDNPRRALTQEDGRFSIADVPPGHWLVRAWHEELGTIEREIDVQAGEVTMVELPLH